MESGAPLISVLVLCYNNQRYLYENLSSIFQQTYPNLEVLIGDDCSSNFNAEQLVLWIRENRTPNIKKITIYEREENLGTVENLERLREESAGEYLFDIAADDKLAHDEVIQRFYDAAAGAGEQAEFLVAQVELWDQKLERKMDDFVKADVIELLKNGTSRDLFAECAWRACLPATNFYHRSILDKVGKLSGSYRLVEDWPTHMRLARMNVRPVYVDMVCVKHRDGGISHGNALDAQKAFLTYHEDLLRAYKREAQPYLDLLTENERERAERYYQERVRTYYSIHLPKYMTQAKAGLRQEEKAGTKNTSNTSNTLSRTSRRKAFLRETLKRFVMSVSQVTVIGGTGLLCVLCFIAAACLCLCWSPIMRAFSVLFTGIGILLLLALFAEILINIWLKIRHFRQDIGNL